MVFALLHPLILTYLANTVVLLFLYPTDPHYKE